MVAIHLANLQRGITVYSSFDISISVSSFMSMKPLTFASDPTSLPSVLLLYYSTLSMSNCSFSGNEISGVKLFGSNVTLSGQLSFINNTAPSGTAFILSKDSSLRLSREGHTIFANNRATNTGGVFYIATNMHYVVEYVDNRATVVVVGTSCFIEVLGKGELELFTFSNNTAGYGGDLIFGGLIANGWDGDTNCLARFENVSRVVPPYNQLSLVSSTPTRVCLCSEAGLPNCSNVLDLQVLSVYPGQNIAVSAVVTGQNFGTVAGSVYAQFLRQSPTHVLPTLESLQYTQGVVQHASNNLSYTVFSGAEEMSNEMLVLTVEDNVVTTVPDKDRVRQTFDMWRSTYLNKYYVYDAVFTSVVYEYPVYVSILISPCPMGFQLTEYAPHSCDCSSLLQTCDIQEQVIVRGGHVWVSVTDTSGSNTTVVSRYCPRGYCRSEQWKVSLSDPDTQCTSKRAGTLCGGCDRGRSLTLGDGRCEVCSNTFLLLLIPFTLAGLALVFFIKILDLTVSQGTINALILYANIIEANKYFLLTNAPMPFAMFIAWINLDLGVNTCFFDGMTAYSNTWLQFVFPIYIWTIAGGIILAAKYSNRAARLVGNNGVPLLATLFLLSYSKLLSAIITALSYIIVHTEHSSRVVWAADGNLDYLGPQHGPLFAAGAAALLLLWLPYILLLFLGQWLQRSNCRVISKFMNRLKPFMDAHYAQFKGNHRYWFGTLLLVRVLVLLVSALSPVDSFGVAAYSISVLSILLTYCGLVVYRSTAVMLFETSFFVNLGITGQTILLVEISGGKENAGVCVLIGIAMAQFLGLVVFKVWSLLRLGERLRTSVIRRRESSEGEWSHWRQSQAALLKDIPDNSERQTLLPSVANGPANYGR